MANEKRVRRMSQLLKEEISKIVLRELKDPRIGFASITKIDVSSDLKHAKVMVSVYGSEQEKKETMEGLDAANKYIRKLVGERLTTYHTPELIFRYDDSIEQGVHISHLIDEVIEEDEKRKDDSEN
ncbi:MAG: 30S ribosome-binding factor RbfA [Halanaerobiales bacterium]|nr:30S ribosome-binding factor RbfA [Halanaerobiales bacterium]